MIRPEVEKLRGTTFTEEELKEVILPMLAADNLKVLQESKKEEH